MKKFLGILVLSVLWCSNVNAEGEGICGIQSNLSNLVDATVSIKIGAHVKVKDNDKNNCKKIVNILDDVKSGNNKFEGYVKDIMVEAKFKSDVEVKTDGFRMTWMNACDRTTFGFHEIGNICTKMEPYKLYLFANHGTVTAGKNLFDKKLDNNSVFDELLNFLN